MFRKFRTTNNQYVWVDVSTVQMIRTGVDYDDDERERQAVHVYLSGGNHVAVNDATVEEMINMIQIPRNAFNAGGNV